MNIIDQIRAIIAQNQIDANLFHDIIHGNDTITVTLESGDVGSISKQIKDRFDQLNINAQIQLDRFGLVITALGDTLAASDEAVARANTIITNSEIFLNDSTRIIQEFRNDSAAFVESAKTSSDEAKIAAGEAKSISSTFGLSLPGTLTGKAGSILGVNDAEDGYKFIGTSPTFYGVQRIGSDLAVDIGIGEYVVEDYPIWSVFPPGADFVVNKDGHLIIEF